MDEGEPDVPRYIDTEDGMMAGETPVVTALEGNNRGSRGAGQAQEVLAGPCEVEGECHEQC